MDSRTQERVESWESETAPAGIDGLRDLADDDFSGAVTVGRTWLFMLNGRIVGIVDGSLDDFEDAQATAYTAPDPALPLLFAMQATGGETRAKYYTNDTPISEVDDTLSSGSFTGYVELSENVLSGDYFVCYYGGRALPVAFVGNSEKLLTGDEAFERADDEVGIYEVKDAEIEVVDLPEPEGDEAEDDAADAAGAGAAAGVVTEAEPDDDEASTTDDRTPDAGSADAASDAPAAGGDDAVAAPPVDDAGETNGGTDTAADDGAVAAPPADDTPTETGRDDRRPSETGRDGRQPHADVDPDEVAARADQADADAETWDPDLDEDDAPGEPSQGRSTGGRAGETPSRDDRTPEGGSGGRGETGGGDPLAGGAGGGAGASAGGGDDPRFEQEAEWRETTSIPSIDPDRSSPAEDSPGGQAAASAEQQPRQSSGASNASKASRSSGRSKSSASSGASSTNRSRRSGRRGDDEPLEQDMLEREDKIDRLQQRISNLEGERDELRAERERLRSKVESLQEEKGSLADENDSLENQVQSLENDVDRLENEVARLEDELETARAGGAAAAAASETLTASQALSGTNLFVRYATKGESTLEDAHSGTATLEDVNENLRLEHHTNFDADDVAVDGRPYEEFLVDSLQFQFVDWAVRDLLFEIRNTGNQDGLRNLYDALPDVDRAELNGAVEIGQPEGDDEEAEAGADIRFDVVLRDRMGNPLVVANVNDSRDAATEGMMVQLNEDAQAVKKRHDEFCSAFMVTTSFFEPGALETAAEATSGSLLSRDSRKSFVKLSRKRGYHLCLVETRSGNFHINVPEL